jgi:hypothetical protein
MGNNEGAVVSTPLVPTTVVIAAAPTPPPPPPMQEFIKNFPRGDVGRIG